MSGVIIAVSWCNRKTKCAYCEEKIEKATPMLIKKVWSGKTKRQYRFPYHFTCWIKEALAYLEKHPYEAATGRRTLKLGDEDRKLRRKLLARRASIRQRIRTWEASGDERASEKIRELLSKELEIVGQIREVGGVPKRWHEVLSDTPEVS